jgi:hypothetical protein
VDLRSVSASPSSHVAERQRVPGTETRATVYAFFKEYRMFFVFITVASVCWVAASAYFSDVLTYERTYQITVEDVE